MTRVHASLNPKVSPEDVAVVAIMRNELPINRDTAKAKAATAVHTLERTLELQRHHGGKNGDAFGSTVKHLESVAEGIVQITVRVGFMDDTESEALLQVVTSRQRETRSLELRQATVLGIQSDGAVVQVTEKLLRGDRVLVLAAGHGVAVVDVPNQLVKRSICKFDVVATKASDLRSKVIEDLILFKVKLKETSARVSGDAAVVHESEVLASRGCVHTAKRLAGMRGGSRRPSSSVVDTRKFRRARRKAATTTARKATTTATGRATATEATTGGRAKRRAATTAATAA